MRLQTCWGRRQRTMFTHAVGILKLDFGKEKAPLILSSIISGSDPDSILSEICQSCSAFIACDRRPGFIRWKFRQKEQHFELAPIWQVAFPPKLLWRSFSMFSMSSRCRWASGLHKFFRYKYLRKRSDTPL
jgi:hypothetical protein